MGYLHSFRSVPSSEQRITERGEPSEREEVLGSRSLLVHKYINNKINHKL